MPKDVWSAIALIIALIGVGCWINEGMIGGYTAIFQHADVQVSGWAGPLPGVLVAGGLGALFFRDAEPPQDRLFPPRLIGAVAVLLVVAMAAFLGEAVVTDHVEPLRATVLLVLGTLSLLVTVYLLDAVRSEGISFDSHWGGIGGGLGGWRISPATALALLLLVLTGSAVTLALYTGEESSETAPASGAEPAAPAQTAAAAEKTK